MSTQETEVKKFDPFAKAYEKMDEMTSEAENAKNFKPMDYEKIIYEGLEINKPVVFRVMGYPAEYREKPTDAKIVLQSKILKDGGKSYNIINWPFVEKKGKYVPDPEWLLTRLYNKVMERKFIPYTEADINGVEVKKQADGSIKNDRGYSGKSVDLHPDSATYKRITNNKKPEEQKSFRQFFPSQRVVMNIDSRMDNWCAIHKHSKILSTKVGVQEITTKEGTKDYIYYPETGISKSMYDDFLTFIRNSCRTWFDRDFIITRTHKNDKYSQTILDGTSLKTLKQGDEKLWSIINDKPTTEEENAYEQYDMDSLFKVASYTKLKTNLSGLFKMFDEEFGEKLYDELVLYAMEEERLRKEAGATEEKEVDAIESDTQPPWIEPIVTTEEVKPRKVRGEASKLDLTTLPFWNKLDKVDQDEMVKYAEQLSDGLVIFKSDMPKAPCSICSKVLPNTVLHCPYCDTELS